VDLTERLGVEDVGRRVVKEMYQKTRWVMTAFGLLLEARDLECAKKYKMCHDGSRLASCRIYKVLET